MAEQSSLTEQERKRLDRQRFIGVETQKRLLAFRVFITPANGINTELVKNLILAGVNVTVYDDAFITEEDFETNFLVAKNQMGKKRGEVILERLKAMNPSGKNQWIDQKPKPNFDKFNEDFFKNYTILVTSQKDFEVVKEWDNISKRANIPYYNQLGCGLYAFSYISLGSQYQYKEVNKKSNQVSKIWEISSLTIEDCLKNENLTKAKQSVFLAALIMMNQAQNSSLNYNPFLESEEKQLLISNEQNLCEIVKIGIEQKDGYKKHEQFFKKFAQTFGIDYCPVYSVVGSIISQQIIKIAQNQSEPGINWLFYDSEEGYASVFKLKSQQELIKSRLSN